MGGARLILLDTHVLVWWISDPGRLSAVARREIEAARSDSRSGLLVSSISTWEIAMLCRKGRLELSEPPDSWIRKVESLPFLRFVPVDNAAALLSNSLPGFHPDPADRLIVATALIERVPLVTKDRRLLDASTVETIW